MKRIENPNFMTIAEAVELKPSTIIDGVEGLKVERVGQRKTGTSQQRNWVRQPIEVSSGGQRYWITCWDMPDLEGLKGKNICIESRENDKNEVWGVSVEQARDKNEIVINRSCLITNMDDETAPEKQWQNNPQSRGVGHQTQRSGQQSSGGRKGVYGGTVGMSVSQSINSYNAALASGQAWAKGMEFGSPKFLKWLHESASDIARVCLMLEGGNLAEPAKKRIEQPADNKEKAASENQKTAKAGKNKEKPQARRAEEEWSENDPVTGGDETQPSELDDDIPF